MLREQTTPSTRAAGALLGALIGDALGMPAHGMSHPNVRMYYKGIKEYRDDERRGGVAGSGTAHAQRLRCLAQGSGAAADCLEGLPPDSAAAAVVAVALGARDAAGMAVLHAHDLSPTARAAAEAHAWAIRHLARCTPATFDAADFWQALRHHTGAAERAAGAPGLLTAQLEALAPYLDEFPLDLHDRCGGTSDVPEEAWVFAVAMFARNPLLVEATLLASINVGGAAATVGALAGSLLGALHGAEAFPPSWRDGLVEG